MGKRTRGLLWRAQPPVETGGLSRSFAWVWALVASGEASDRVRTEETKRFVEQRFARLHAMPC